MPLRFENAGSTIVLAAHPDDESIGMSAILSSLPALVIIHATDGAPEDLQDARRCGYTTRAEYASARRLELHRALEVAESDHAELIEWGIPDKQAARHLVQLTNLLVPMLRSHDLLLTHPYEGGHPDHDACAFVAHAAARLCRKKLTLAEFSLLPPRPGRPDYIGVPGRLAGSPHGRTHGGAEGPEALDACLLHHTIGNPKIFPSSPGAISSRPCLRFHQAAA